MWHALLQFYHDLILFTAGTAVSLFWIAVFIVGGIELHDMIQEHYFNKEDEGA